MTCLNCFSQQEDISFFPISMDSMELFEHTDKEDLSKIKMRLVQQGQGKKDEEEKEEKGLFCRCCDHLITYAKEQTPVNGKYLHTFINPHGIVYEIGTFREAKGLVAEGLSQREWSWFPPYAWQIQRCSVCLSHIGWYFTNQDNAFFGLVLANLKES